MKTNLHVWSYPAQFFLEWQMFQTTFLEKIKRHFMFNYLFFFSENRVVYEIMWKNIVERGRPQMTIQRMRIACWVTEATNTHSEYVKIIAFPLQQWLHERLSISGLRTSPVFKHGEWKPLKYITLLLFQFVIF